MVVRAASKQISTCDRVTPVYATSMQNLTDFCAFAGRGVGNS